MRAPVIRRGPTLTLAAALSLGCAEEVPNELSSWGLFEDGATQTPAEGVVPYALISPLFSDYTAKHRFIRLPEGGQITYTDEDDWLFPTGTVISKTFSYPYDLRDPSIGERLLETRLLVLGDDEEWDAYVYQWNEEQTEAVRARAGARVSAEWMHHDGTPRELDYRIPNEVQCANCHGGAEPMTPIGPRTAQMDRDFDYDAGLENQIDHMAALGMFANDVPAERVAFVAPDADASLDARARGYLDANCAHCHSEHGAAAQSGLWLDAHIEDPAVLGVCKRPVAAGRGAGGRRFDIVPGDPDASVMVFRMESEEPGIKMPELPSQLAHAEGVALIREWIAAMEPAGCE
jgi:uncharacterized repeat protein (TIGR03806 family)